MPFLLNIIIIEILERYIHSFYPNAYLFQAMCFGSKHHRLWSPLIIMVRENVGGRLRTNNVMGGMFLPCCGQACFRIYIYINVFVKVVSDKSQCEISYSMLFIIHKYWIDQYFFEEKTVSCDNCNFFLWNLLIVIYYLEVSVLLLYFTSISVWIILNGHLFHFIILRNI